VNELFRRALMLPPQASSVAHRIDVLHYTVIGTAFLVAFLSFVFVVIFLIRFRERPGRKPPRYHPTHRLEIGMAGFTLAVFIAWWCVGFSQYRDIHEVPNGALRIHVVAKQWMWQFVYPNGANSEDVLRVPVGQPVEVLITSRDVIHSFYVPAFRLKQDAVPGRITTIWFTATMPGEFPILCAEYCGAGHSRMRGRVVAMQPGDFANWVSGHTSSDLATAGERLANSYGCLRCHTSDGTTYTGPTWRGLYGSKVQLTNGQQVIADDAYLTESMMDPMVKIVRGYAAVMPSYLGILSGPEAAAIVEYIHSLKDPRRTP
jgi:cytochrome c oxidase subunit 2